MLSSILAPLFVAENEAFSTKNAHSARHNRFQCVFIAHRSHSATQSAGNDGKKSSFTVFKYCRVKKHSFTGKKPKIDFVWKNFAKLRIFSFGWQLCQTILNTSLSEDFRWKTFFSRFYSDFCRISGILTPCVNTWFLRNQGRRFWCQETGSKQFECWKLVSAPVFHAYEWISTKIVVCARLSKRLFFAWNQPPLLAGRDVEFQNFLWKSDKMSKNSFGVDSC